MGATKEPKKETKNEAKEEDGDDDDEEAKDVEESLKDAVEGTIRLKRILSEDLHAETVLGPSKKKAKVLSTNRVGPAVAAKVTSLLTRWGALDDVVLRHVLEGLKLPELDAFASSGYVPDKFNAWKSCAELTAIHIAQSRERAMPGGGGPIDTIAAFRHRKKLDAVQEALLRKLGHKDLRYVIANYDSEKHKTDLQSLLLEAARSEAAEGTALGVAVSAPGATAIGRFHRLELIDPTADAAVFGDANLSFALNLARHRKALCHVGRVIATCFESLEVLRERYKEIDKTIAILEEHYADVYQEVDCTRIALHPSFKGLEGKLGAVYYNFPHAGAVGGFFDGHPLVNWRHENLMKLFFRALRSFVKPGGVVKVASNMSAVGVRFSYITGSAESNEFTHIETVPFLQWSLHRYGRSYGDRRDAYRRPEEGEGYNVQRAEKDMVYTFRFDPSGKTLPPQEIRMPPTFKTIECCKDGPFENISQGEPRKNLTKTLYKRFMMECSGQHVG